jgi:hypothetical protein
MVRMKKHIRKALMGASFNRGVFGYFFFGNIFAIILASLLTQCAKKFLREYASSKLIDTFIVIVITILIIYIIFSLIILFNTLRKTNSYIKKSTVYGSLAIFLIYGGISYMKFKGFYTTEITINGSIQPSTFIQVRDLIDRSIVRPKRIIINSSGGSAEASIAIGMLIYSLNIDIEVTDLCASSCANYIFTSGRRKFLNRNSIVLFHGGMQQKNLLSSIVSHFNSEEKTSSNSGSENKEGVVTTISEEEKANLAIVNSYIGLEPQLSPEEHYAKLSIIENKFFQEREIDRRILTYGQMGEYEKIYQSKKYFGFYYSIESMISMGIKNIHIIGDKWSPELNPNIGDFYEVKIN